MSKGKNSGQLPLPRSLDTATPSRNITKEGICRPCPGECRLRLCSKIENSDDTIASFKTVKLIYTLSRVSSRQHNLEDNPEILHAVTATVMAVTLSLFFCPRLNAVTMAITTQSAPNSPDRPLLKNAKCPDNFIEHKSTE